MLCNGGTAPYIYRWSNGSTNASVYGLPPGSYTLVVRDANSCTANLTSTVTQPPQYGLNVAVVSVSCNGTATGEIDLTVDGATPPYRFQWSNGATTEDISGLVGGIYSLTVTGASNCVEITPVLSPTQPDPNRTRSVNQRFLANEHKLCRTERRCYQFDSNRWHRTVRLSVE